MDIWKWFAEAIEEGDERRQAEAEKIRSTARAEGYAEGEQEGISKTLQALYEANVEDDEIIRVMNKVYDIPQREVHNLLVKEKEHAIFTAMHEYLSLQGYSRLDRRHFIDQTNAVEKIRNNPKLWTLRRKPKELIDILQDEKKLKQFLNGTSKKR